MNKANRTRFVNKVIDLWHNAPCNICQNQHRCQAERMSCKAFNEWIQDGHRRNPSMPTRCSYKRIFRA